MIELLASVLGASFVGSLHCAGMCGGLVAFCAGTEGRGSLAARTGAYQGGRLLAYATLGVIGGLLGAGIDDAGSRVGLSRIAAVLAGGTMIAWAGVLLLGSASVFDRARLPAALSRVIGGLVARLRDRPPVVRAASMGLASALLPCGWLYAFVLVAAGTGSAVTGALTMAAFWLGTVPSLLGVSIGARALARRVGRRLPILSAVALIVVGMTTVLGRASLPMPVPASASQYGTKIPAGAPCHGH